MATYLEISPRGFSNETFIVCGSRAAVAVADSIINDDVNAWSRPLRAASSAVRAARREEVRYGYPVIERLAERHVTRHRPVYLHDDGTRSLGRERLPV